MRSTLAFAFAAALAVAASATNTMQAAPVRGSLFTVSPSVSAGHARVESVGASFAGAGYLHAAADGAPMTVTGSNNKNCAVCTLGVSLIEQYAMEQRVTLVQAASTWCADATSAMPSVTGLCQSVLAGNMAKLQADFDNQISPDVSCRTTFNECAADVATCHLYPIWPLPPHAEEARHGVPEDASLKKTHDFYAQTVGKLLNVHAVSEEILAAKFEELAKNGGLTDSLKEKLANSKGGKWLPVPIPDWDQDKYGATFTYRGLQWRGKDCNDQDATVYPGRNAQQGDFDAKHDTNCNGISGVDAASGLAYEKALCGETPPRGILAIGDSATAHFSLPPTWVTPADWDATTYADLFQVLLTEADWPQCSWSTGWGDSTTCPPSVLNVSSVYQRMLDRNQCNFRDYVNLGVNGASVMNLIDDGVVTPANYTGNMQAIPSRFKVDGPSTVFFAMVGNDICRAHEWNGYTPTDVFNTKVREEFAYLDTILAPGSNVIIMGLVDGRVLYDTLKNDVHPAGATYMQFYDYLNCIEVSPCWSWMNSNQTIRDASYAHTLELNAVYTSIISSVQYKNFDLHFFFPDFQQLITEWTAAGHDARDLIEPVDGFHPSQTGNMLLAEKMWAFIGENVPQAMGEINPNNAQIKALFGSQGGYQ